MEQKSYHKEHSQLENHIAFSSGEAKGKSVMTGARAVVDILLASNRLIQDGDKLIINSDSNITKPTIEAKEIETTLENSLQPTTKI